jgi:hypothetical protein
MAQLNKCISHCDIAYERKTAKAFAAIAIAAEIMVISSGRARETNVGWMARCCWRELPCRPDLKNGLRDTGLSYSRWINRSVIPVVVVKRDSRILCKARIAFAVEHPDDNADKRCN